MCTSEMTVAKLMEIIKEWYDRESHLYPSESVCNAYKDICEKAKLFEKIVFCKDCTQHATHNCPMEDGKFNPTPNGWFCADGVNAMGDKYETDDPCCRNCSSSKKTGVDGLVDCDLDGRSKDADMVCDHWTRQD